MSFTGKEAADSLGIGHGVTLEADDEEQEEDGDDADGIVMSCDEGGSSGITLTSTASDDSSIV